MKTPTVNLLNFLSVCAEKVKSMLDDIDSSKAAGFDNILLTMIYIWTLWLVSRLCIGTAN